MQNLHAAPLAHAIGTALCDGNPPARLTAQLRLLRRPEVEAMTGLARSTMNDAIRAGKFPKPVPLGSRTVAWSSDEVAEWVAARIAARDAKAAAP